MPFHLAVVIAFAVLIITPMVFSIGVMMIRFLFILALCQDEKELKEALLAMTTRRRLFY